MTDIVEALSWRYPAASFTARDGVLVEVRGVEWPTEQEIAQIVSEYEAAKASEAIRKAALAEIEAVEKRSLRALRELVLSLVEPGVMPAEDVAVAEAKLIEAEQKIRVERAKLG